MTQIDEPKQWAIKQHIKKNPKCEWLCTHTKLENLGEQPQIDEPNLDEQIRIVLKDYDQFITTKQAISDIKALIATQIQEARINELRAIEPPEQYKDYAMISGHDACAMCGFNAIKFGEFIEDRIAQLRSTQ